MVDFTVIEASSEKKIYCLVQNDIRMGMTFIGQHSFDLILHQAFLIDSHLERIVCWLVSTTE
jgi:hypothetical protein